MSPGSGDGDGDEISVLIHRKLNIEISCHIH
jgi:hypothetical protein